MTLSLRTLATAQACLALLTACSGGVHTSAANPVNLLLTIDQLESPGFTVETAATVLTPSATAIATEQNLATLRANDLTQAASVSFFRDAGTLAISNGPLQVNDTVEVFPTGGAASAQLRSDISARESDRREQPISTGPLGSEAHADTNIAVAPDLDQTSVIQITVEWRLNNLLNLMVVRGRYGGARLADALLLAGRQNQNEEQGGAPRITPSPSGRVTPAKSPTPIRPPTVAPS